MTNSRRKGAGGELEFSRPVFDTMGVRLVRQLEQCRAGGFDLAPERDDDSAGARRLRQFAVEVKRHRTATAGEVDAWWLQTVRQAETAGLDPMLAYRPDRQPWRVMVGLQLIVPGTAPHTVTLTLDAFAAITDGTDSVTS